MKKLSIKNTTLVLSTAILLATTPVDSFASHGGAGVCKVETKVNGLVCDFCARALNKVFSKQQEVEKIDVNLDSGLVAVFLKPDQNLPDKKIKKLITDAGYNVASLSRQGCE